MANEDLMIWEPNARESQWLNNHETIRSYEVSIWTLQDDFITVLKYSNVENKGQIQDGKVKFDVDGTQELTFSIPMYLYDNEGNILKENPIWYNTRNGNIVVDMRKVKLIFNKDTDEEAVYEFVIIKINERHSKNQLFCDVTCEGLAFHELGKIGYKISLTSDNFYNNDYDWFKNGSWKDNMGRTYTTQPLANLQYWLNEFLSSSYESPNKWYYQIEMDYTAYKDAASRSSSIVYEEEYASSWEIDDNDQLRILKTEPYTEKARLVDLEESNIYNITQNLAETFGVFCRYEYGHDSNYHITSRKIIFYNNFINERDSYISFTYPYSTSEITREMDSTDLITKMFVRQVEDETTASGLLTIIDTEANNTGEDYLLNFDYLYKTGAISEEQYQTVQKYEAQMKYLNLQIAPLGSQIVALSAQLPSLEAKVTIAKNAIQLDTERIGMASDLFNAITGGGEEIQVTPENPDTAVLLEDSSRPNSSSYYIDLSKQGIDASSIRIFRYFDVTKTGYSTEGNTEETKTHHNGRLYVELKTGQFEYDEYGDVIKVRNLYTLDENRRIVFVTYNYTPRLYYEKVLKTWKARLAKDTADRDKYEAELTSINNSIALIQEQYDQIIEQKKAAIKNFEAAMGPALREGYWTPDDYKDCGDSYHDEIVISTDFENVEYDHRLGSGSETEKSLINHFIWDEELFTDENDCKRAIGVNQQEQTYPCINLTRFINTICPNNITDLEEIKNRVDNLSFFFCDYNGSNAYSTSTLDAGKMRAFAVGSQCQYGFVKQEISGIDTVIPVLILTGIDTIPESFTTSVVTTTQNDQGQQVSSEMTEITFNTIDFIKSKPMYIGALQVGSASSSNALQFAWSAEVTTNDLLEANSFVAVYPRMQIDSLAVKTSSDQLFVTYNKTEIKNIEDYYCLSKIPENSSSDASYYITLKPKTILYLGGLNKAFGVRYVISNADTSIYLDAKKILKENAFPKVSYEIKLSVLNRNFIHNAYKRLSYITKINDTKLKFENTMGYISQLELNLDKPQDDKVEVKNYKTKFEDLFSSIVSSSEEMKKVGYAVRAAASAFDAYGSIKPWVIANSIYKADLDYAFNNGNLTIDDKNGIWGVSASGVVAIRGGGIFTSTEQDGNGNWKWNTGITPEGINASLITTGQLDTNRIMVYAGDKLRFQLNGEGLFAYKSFFEDLEVINGWLAANSNDLDNFLNYSIQGKRMQEINEMLNNNSNSDLDAAQFVKMDQNGLFLVAKPGAFVLNGDKTDYVKIGESLFTWVDQNNDNVTFNIPESGIERVGITWDGFNLRNYYNDKVFSADADTGDLQIKGVLYASELHLGGGSDAALSLNQYFGEPNNLILNGLTENIIQNLLTKNITHVYYTRESELVTYLCNASGQPDSSHNGDIWYNLNAPSSALTLFKIKYIANPVHKVDSFGNELPLTAYDYWKMEKIETSSQAITTKAFLGMYQSNVKDSKYITIYKGLAAATTTTQEVISAPTSTISFTETGTGANQRFIATVTDTEGTVSTTTVALPLDEQSLDYEPLNIEQSELNHGDIWINQDINNNVLGLYYWAADFINEEIIVEENSEEGNEEEDNEEEDNEEEGEEEEITSTSLGRWILIKPISNDTSKTSIYTKLNDARATISRIANGERGLIFQNNQGEAEIELNKRVGLKIVSKGGAYFRVNSQEFGFIANDGKTPYLYYDSGNLYIMGTIFAKSFYVYDKGIDLLANQQQIQGQVATMTPMNFNDYLAYDFENKRVNSTAFITGITNVITDAVASLSDQNINNYNTYTNFRNAISGYFYDKKTGIDITNTGITIAAQKDIKIGTYNSSSNTLSGIQLSDNGIWLGTNKTINFYSTNNLNSSSASMSLSSDQILLGVSGQNNSSVVKMQQGEIIVGTQHVNNNVTTVSGIIIRPSELSMASAGTVQLVGTVGKIQFGSNNEDVTFRVDESGNIYCNSITCKNGITTTQQSIPTQTDTTPSVIENTVNLSGAITSGGRKTINFGQTVIPTAGTYDIIIELSKQHEHSGYFKNVELTGLGDTRSCSMSWPQTEDTKTLQFSDQQLNAQTYSPILYATLASDQSYTINITSAKIKIYGKNFKSGSTEATVTASWAGATYTVKRNSDNLQIASTTVSGSWLQSATTYNSYPSNTYTIAGTGASSQLLSTQVYGYQDGSTYYVKTTGGATLFTDSVSATETVTNNVTPSLNVTGMPSGTALGQLGSSITPTNSAQQIYIQASGTNVNPVYGYITINAAETGTDPSVYETRYNALSQEIRNIYIALRQGAKIGLSRDTSSNKIYVKIVKSGSNDTYIDLFRGYITCWLTDADITAMTQAGDTTNWAYRDLTNTTAFT